MDPLTALQSRIEQLEARLGTIATEPALGDEVVRAGSGESAMEALLTAANCIDTATAGQEKLAAAAQRASELDNYTDPNFMHNLQETDMKTQEILASEPVVRHHCHCMHMYQKMAPVLDSEALQAVPQIQADLTQLQTSAAQLYQEAEQVVGELQEVAETCGGVATSAADVIIDVARKVDAAETKMFPKRRNGLD